MKRYDNVYAVVIAGGEGRRLWPLSTPESPKQFISVFGGKSLIRHAVDRLEGLIPPERTFVVTAAKFVGRTRRELPHIPSANIIGEPCRRDTAGAVAIACALVKRSGGGDAVGCVLPADQLIYPPSKFRRTLRDGVTAAMRSDAIVTIGIVPDRPASEYGYIECGEEAGFKTKSKIEHVHRFIEKPDTKTAEAYLKTNRYLWNAGMFIWRAKTLENAFAAAPDIGKIINRLTEAKSVPAALKRLYPGLRAISFDYAVMEKTGNILVARGLFKWDDVGSWLSLSKHFRADAFDNRCIGNTAVYETSASTVVSDDGHLVAVAGLNDVVVVRTGNATLVMSSAMADRMKTVCSVVTPADAN
jgi:mannose-1-phosphate guanylyltransferase